MKRILLLITAILFSNLSFAQQLDFELLKAIKPRNIGPAGMSGRITSFDVLLSDTRVIYAGTASGGLWRSKSGGTTWESIFDKEEASSIGVVKVQQDNPSVIWVGTGEGNPRNSQNMGYGVYKSIDGGMTWKNMGLKNSRTIHRLIIDPTDPNTVYVGVHGDAWADTEERGVYKTTDGGKTWNKILFANNRTGVADMIMDPTNPNKLIVAMWEYRRWPWFFKSGGEGSGLHITYDGGETWKKLSEKDGLPKGELGRIGLAQSLNKPNVVYALIESKKNALYRSDDGGNTFKMINNKNDIGDRPFYYADIYVDPTNEQRVYTLYSRVAMSEDGGKNFRVILPYYGVHPDHHAWWIHPTDPNFMIDGNDGGMNITRDGGKTWRFIENIPLAQFYHINVDNEWPYNVYGGMQDNGSWRGPAYVWKYSGIRNTEWQEVLFGDGFDVVPDPVDSRYGYAMSQGGNVARYDHETGFTQSVRPIHPDGTILRFNWNAPIAISPQNSNTIYYGSQFLHKSTDQGKNWEVISPDLTTNDPKKQTFNESGGLTYDVTQAENHTTTLAIAPSPLDENIIWVGTDDGNVQLTTDGGKTWRNKIKGMKGAPKHGWVAQIHASKYKKEEAYVVINNYRQGDWNAYLYRTRNFGKKWERVVDTKKIPRWLWSFKQDVVEPKLLFVGSEVGLYVSIDEGKNWTKWTEGFPTVSTSDLAIQEREHDLVIGTFGRAAWVIDNIQPLRQLAKNGIKELEKPVVVYPTSTAVQAQYKQPPGIRFNADAMFDGDNRGSGAQITYSVNTAYKNLDKKMKKEAKIEILKNGEVIRTLKQKPEKGMNRVTWGLREKGMDNPLRQNRNRESAGNPVLPGIYTVRISYNGGVDSTTVEVVQDPRITFDLAIIKEMNEKMDYVSEMRFKMNKALKQLRDAKESLDLIKKQIPAKDTTFKAVKKQMKALGDSMKVINEMFTGKQDVQGIFRSQDIISAKISNASRYVRSGMLGMGSSQEIAIREGEKALKMGLDKVNSFFENQWKPFQEEVNNLNLSPFKQWEKL